MKLFDNPLVERFLGLFPSHQRLKEQVFVDPLTGLGNRRALEKAFTREVARVRRGMGEPLSVVMIDVDHFKLVNDSFGHPVGDEILTKLGGLLKSKARITDFVGRVGGEEFILVLPATPLEGAWRHAEDVRKHIERHLVVDVVSDDGVTHVARTVSIGVATWDGKEIVDAFLSRADSALYAAKNSGRNCTRSA